MLTIIPNPSRATPSPKLTPIPYTPSTGCPSDERGPLSRSHSTTMPSVGDPRILNQKHSLKCISTSLWGLMSSRNFGSPSFLPSNSEHSTKKKSTSRSYPPLSSFCSFVDIENQEQVLITENVYSFLKNPLYQLKFNKLELLLTNPTYIHANSDSLTYCSTSSSSSREY